MHTRTRRLDAGLYETLDGQARIESAARMDEGIPSDYGIAGWWLKITDEDPQIYNTKSEALDAYDDYLWTVSR
jgi:hypothetical protein